MPENPYYRRNACGSRIFISHRATRIHARNRSLAADAFSRLANKSPMRRTVMGAGLGSCKDYYTTLDFIHRRCQEMNGAVMRACLTSAGRLPEATNIAIDSQSLMVGRRSTP